MLTPELSPTTFPERSPPCYLESELTSLDMPFTAGLFCREGIFHFWAAAPRQTLLPVSMGVPHKRLGAHTTQTGP